MDKTHTPKTWLEVGLRLILGKIVLINEFLIQCKFYNIYLGSKLLSTEYEL